MEDETGGSPELGQLMLENLPVLAAKDSCKLNSPLQEASSMGLPVANEQHSETGLCIENRFQSRVHFPCLPKSDLKRAELENEASLGHRKSFLHNNRRGISEREFGNTGNRSVQRVARADLDQRHFRGLKSREAFEPRLEHSENLFSAREPVGETTHFHLEEGLLKAFKPQEPRPEDLPNFQKQFSSKTSEKSSSAQESTQEGDEAPQFDRTTPPGPLSRPSGRPKLCSQRHSAPLPHACLECGKRFRQRSDLQRHSFVHSEENQFPCRLCEKRFAHASGLRIHERSHSGDKPYRCPVCHKTFGSSSNLAKHRFVHSEGKRFPCSACGKSFKHPASLNAHRKRGHSDGSGRAGVPEDGGARRSRRRKREQSLPCRICGRIFGGARTLEAHLLLHAGDPKLGCFDCDLLFGSREEMEVHQSFHRLVQEGSPGIGEIDDALFRGGPTGRRVVVAEESDRELSREGETVLEEEGRKVSQNGLGCSEGCEHLERQRGEGVIGERPGGCCELGKRGEGLPCVRNGKLRELRQGGAAERYAEDSESARHTNRGGLGEGLRGGLGERLGGGMTDKGLFSERHQEGNQNHLTGSMEVLEQPRVNPDVQDLRARLWNIVEQCSDVRACREQLREFWRGFRESRTCEGAVDERQGEFLEQGCTKKNASAGYINRLQGSRAGFGPEVRDNKSSLGYSQSRNRNGVQSAQNVLEPGSCQRGFTEKRLGPESTARGLPHQNVLEADSRNGGFQNGLEHSRDILKEGSGCSLEEVLECSRSGRAPKQGLERVGSLSRVGLGNRDFMERIRDILENSLDGKMCRERLERFWKGFGERMEGREREHWGGRGCRERGNETATEREGDGQNRGGNGKQRGRDLEERRRERKNNRLQRKEKRWRENREEHTRTEQIGTDRNPQRLKAGLERDREETAEIRTAPSNRKSEPQTPRITENQPPRAGEQEIGERAEGGLMELETKGTSLKEERDLVLARGILEYNGKVGLVPERGGLEEEERIGRDLRDLELKRGRVVELEPELASLEEYREVEKEEHSQNLTLQRAGSDAEGRTGRDLAPARGTAPLNLPYKCGLCPAAFCRPSEAKAHVQEHSPGRPYPCPHCPRRFRRRFDVLRHGRVHSGEKPFACAVCQRRFSQAGTLRTHSLVHSQDKPHRCPLCPAGFRRSADLRLHQRRHSGDKRYPCSLCDKAFVQSNALLAHQQTHYRRERRRQRREQESERH